MKKVIGLISGLVLVVTVALAGVKTDKIMFGDDTEMTTAATGGGVQTNAYNVFTTSNKFETVTMFGDESDNNRIVVDPNNANGIIEVSNIQGTSYIGGEYTFLRVAGGLGTEFSGFGDVYFTGNIGDAPWHLLSHAVSGSDYKFYIQNYAEYESSSVAFEKYPLVKLKISSIEGGTPSVTDTWLQFAQSTAGTVDTDGDWRMGVVNSNFVVQVRVSGVWTNATSFQRP